MHDGETFGVQEIVDRGVRLNASFVKREGGRHGGEWTARYDILHWNSCHVFVPNEWVIRSVVVVITKIKGNRDENDSFQV